MVDEKDFNLWSENEDTKEVKMYDYCKIDLIIEKVDEIFNDKLILTDKGTITCTNGTINVNDENYNLLIRSARDVMNELITNYIMMKELYVSFRKDPGFEHFKKNRKGEDIYNVKGMRVQNSLENIMYRYIEKYISLQANRINSFLLEIEFFANGLHNLVLDEIEADKHKNTGVYDNRLYTYMSHLFNFQIESYNLEFNNRDEIMKMIDEIRINVLENKKYKLSPKTKMYSKIIKILKTMYQVSINENQMICEFVQNNIKRFIEVKYNTHPCFIFELHRFLGKLCTCIIDNFCKKAELLKVYDPSENVEPYEVENYMKFGLSID